jgi:hypothetical protein
MGEDNLEKNRSLEHATMQLMQLYATYATMQLYATYTTMQLMQQDFDDILTLY